MIATLPAPPGIRMRPAPACDPPFEDGDHRESAPFPGQPLLMPLFPPSPQLGHTRPQPRTPAAPPVPVETSAATRAAASRFMNTCLEILNGYRPVTHLRALSSPMAAATVLDAMTHAMRRVTAETRHRRCRVTLRRMRVCEPRAGVAEISAVLAVRDQESTAPPHQERCWAAAFRLEQRGGRWQCQVAHLL